MTQHNIITKEQAKEILEKLKKDLGFRDGEITMEIITPYLKVV